MSNVFVIGGAGKVSRRLAKQLSERGHVVSAMHRNPEPAALGANVGLVAGELAIDADIQRPSVLLNSRV